VCVAAKEDKYSKGLALGAVVGIVVGKRAAKSVYNLQHNDKASQRCMFCI